MQGDSETIKQPVAIGVGVSILPKPTAQMEVKAGLLRAVPLMVPELWRPLGIIHRQRKVFTPTVTKFVELLHETTEYSDENCHA